MKTVIQTKQLKRAFLMGEVVVDALRGVDLTVVEGEFVAVMGASGSGKSTLMNLLGCLDQPTSGEYFLDGTEVSTMKRDEYARIRNEKIGFVFQGFNLLSRTSTVENVELPLMYDASEHITDTRQAAIAMLIQVGLGDRLDHQPNQLSGGQQQRVAIARALINNPTLLLADEPTGNLDSKTSVEVMALFQQLNDKGITVIMVTHEPDIALYATRIVELRDGLIIRDERVMKRKRASEEILTFASAPPAHALPQTPPISRVIEPAIAI